MAGLRTELKFYLSSADASLLSRRLSFVLHPDVHAPDGDSYTVRSLYFDDPAQSSYYDKIHGVQHRTKYRIRFYNEDLSYLRLEKKEKIGSKILKNTCVISQETAQRLIFCDTAGLDGEGLLGEFVRKIRFELFRPCLFVDYRRRAYCSPAGNVRISLDSSVQALLFRQELFGSGPYLPVLEPGETILEMKYDSFLPSYIASLFTDIPALSCAISKFCLCRECFM